MWKFVIMKMNIIHARGNLVTRLPDYVSEMAVFAVTESQYIRSPREISCKNWITIDEHF